MELYSKYRESVIFLIKFDIGILVIFSTAITILKLERLEVIKAVSQTEYIICSILLIIILGLIIERQLVLEYDTNDESLIKKNRKTFKYFLIIQTGLNIFLLGYLAFFSFLYVEDYLTYNRQDTFANQLGEVIMKQIKEEKRLPESLDVVLDANPFLKSFMNEPGISMIKYDKITNPISLELNESELNERIIQLFREELSKSFIKDIQSDSYKNYIKKYPLVWNRIKTKPIEHERKFTFLLTLPGYDLKINTQDDFQYKFTNILLFQTILSERN